MSAMRAESKRYFAALGAHITQLRKAREMTQAELARAIGVSQQAVFAYELGERRVSVLILAKIGKVLAISVEELIGMSRPVPIRKSRLSPRAMRHAERLQALSKTQQRFVIRIIDTLEVSSPRLRPSVSDLTRADDRSRRSAEGQSEKGIQLANRRSTADQRRNRKDQTP